MVADAKMYDEMELDEEAPESEETEADEVEAGADDLDETFKLHAEAAGMNTPAKLEAFKMAIERCVELREQNAYVPDEAEGDVDVEDELEEV
jgi:hypothetical protein